MSIILKYYLKYKLIIFYFIKYKILLQKDNLKGDVSE